MGPFDKRSPGQEGLPELMLEGPGAEPKRMKAAVTLIGSAAGCRVRISDSSISRYHAALHRTRSGAWVVDLMSRNGLSINGARVRLGKVNHGDELQVGRFHLQVRTDLDLPALMAAPSAVQALQACSWFSPPVLPPMPVGAGEDSRTDTLVHQFGQMQQQMFNHFQQSLMMMFQVFRTMHQDQAELVKAELDRVRTLGEELQELQAQAAKSAARASSVEPPNGSPDRPTPPRPAPPRPAPSSLQGASPNSVNPDVHLLLHRRIAAIQEERQGLAEDSQHGGWWCRIVLID